MDMDVDEIDKQVCKVSRISNDSNNKIGQNGGGRGGGGRGRGRGEHPYREDEEEEGGGGGGRLGTCYTSRIFRVSRASGGKDRHSKVVTAKGLRDRRVRLSVSTAIQFYDLQDRLGYDQPSKAVEWLIKAAADAITELPSLDTKFPQPIQQQSEERDEEDVELLHEADTQQQQLSRSACSSTSETSKGGGGSSSVLSLSRTESRVKARERARERAAKDKMKDDNESHIAPHQHHQNSQQSSFTELLTGGGAGGGGTRQHFPQTTPLDYFSSGLFGQRNYFSLGGFSGQNQHLAMAAQHPFSITNGDHQQHHHPEMQHFSFLPDHMIPEAAEAEAVTGSDYNLNFSISSGLAGYNRGTLQSNSPSSLPHSNLQRFSSHVEGTNIPFFIGNVAAAPSSAAPSAETQFQAGFDARLQLSYGDGSSRHSDLKGKGKA